MCIWICFLSLSELLICFTDSQWSIHHISLEQIYPHTQWLMYDSKSKCLSSALSKANVRWLSLQYEAYCFSTQIQLAYLFQYSYSFLNSEPFGWSCAKQSYNKHRHRYTLLRILIATCSLSSVHVQMRRFTFNILGIQLWMFPKFPHTFLTCKRSIQNVLAPCHPPTFYRTIFEESVLIH